VVFVDISRDIFSPAWLLSFFCYTGYMNQFEDTIAAVSTPPGYGGIAIVRLSGPEAFRLASRLTPFGVEGMADHTARYCVASWAGEALDEAIVLKMCAPKTYTREDIVEIQCHGGYMAAGRVLASLIEAGARLAGPGEFTKRAFLNGRIDLSQAEAVMDIVNAGSQSMLAAAERQLGGYLRERVGAARQKALSIASSIEASLEYPEYEEAWLQREELTAGLAELSAMISGLLEQSRRSKAAKEGFAVAIAGAPNVGKSSLLNALTASDKAIVTEIPGTTRDIVEGQLAYKGLLLRFFDTAGLRESEDVVESIGIERAKAAIASADLALIVVDGSAAPAEEEKEKAYAQANAFGVLNKSDLGIEPRAREAYRGAFEVSAKTGDGLESLLEAIYAAAVETSDIEPGFLAGERHIEALTSALAASDAAGAALEAGWEEEIASTELREAIASLGRITGEELSEDVIDGIFEKFCLGK